MKLPFKSIRWRLQMWNGAILGVVLAAFGCTAYQLAFANRLRLIDQELQHQANQLFEAIGPASQSPAVQEAFRKALAVKSGSSAFDVVSDAGTNQIMPDRSAIFRVTFETVPLPDLGDFYFAFWRTNNTIIRRSANCPAVMVPPSVSSSGFANRTRQDFRELTIANKDFRIVVGRSITGDLTDLHRQAWLMSFIGAGVALVGLAGGWWLAARAIKPIAEISSAAQKITSGNLAQRINVSDTDSELGQLAVVLNTTFDRQQSAFEQLKRAFERQTEFTADASHELRTPVAVIIAEAESALARERSPEEYREGMESCLRAACRMQRLTEALLTLARLDSGGYGARRERCDLERVTHETVDLLRPLAKEHGVSLQAELTPAFVIGDGEQLGLVVSNLVSNAISYNRPGGGVCVHIALKHEVILTVSDDGLGIAPENLTHIFERFYRADKARSRSGGHVGLGLAIAKAIVESHGGTIQVASVFGKGCAFTVSLPRAVS